MISIVLPISRTEYLRPVFNCLKELECPDDTDLIVIVDGPEELFEKVRTKAMNLDFMSTAVYQFGQEPAKTINERRYRISDIHNYAKMRVSPDSDWVFLIEDDTTYPPETISHLLYDVDFNRDALFVEGVELSRHNRPYIGAWHVDDCENPESIKSAMVSDLRDQDNLTQIDAGGFYCALTDAKFYRSHHFEPYDKVGTNGLSCDFNYGMAIRKAGGICLLDWSIQCDHIGERGSVNIGNTKPVQVEFYKRKEKWEVRL